MSPWSVKQVKNQIMVEREERDFERARACLPSENVVLVVPVWVHHSTVRKILRFIADVTGGAVGSDQRVLAVTGDRVFVLVEVGIRKQKHRIVSSSPLAALRPLVTAEGKRPLFMLGDETFEVPALGVDNWEAAQSMAARPSAGSSVTEPRSLSAR